MEDRLSRKLSISLKNSAESRAVELCDAELLFASQKNAPLPFGSALAVSYGDGNNSECS